MTAKRSYAPLNTSEIVPIANLASGTPDGTKFVRDDNILAVPPGTGATLGTPALTLSTSNATGAASTAIGTDATIAAFDATVPVSQALNDTAATGSAGKAARRDHKHGMFTGAAPSGGYGSAAAGSAATVLRSDAVLAKPTAPDVDFSADVTNNNATTGHHGLLLKLSGSSGDALLGDGSWGAITVGGVTTSNIAYSSGDITTTSSLADVTGCSLSLDAGTYIIAGTFDVLVNNALNDRTFEGHLDVNGSDQTNTATEVALGLVNDRGAAVQHWRVTLASTQTVKLRAKHSGGTVGDFTVKAQSSIAAWLGGTASFATPAVVLSTAAAAGTASTSIRSDSTIVAFDGTVPAAVGTAATGSQAVAARRDHVHATGAGTPSTQAFGDSAATGTGPAASMTDHKHGMPATPKTVANDTIWDAAGDLAVGTGSDTAARLAITVPAANILEVVGVVNGETTASWKAVHDSTAPVTQAFGDSAAAGTALTASHRDHKHGMPASPSGLVTHSTVGTTAAGAAFETARQIYMKKITMASAGLIISISGQLKGNAANNVGFSVAIYADNSGTPSNVIAVGAPLLKESDGLSLSNLILSTTVRAVTCPIGYWAVAADYWLAVNLDAAADSRIDLAMNSGTGSDRTQNASTFRDHSVTATSTGTNDHSIFADILTLS